RCAGAGAPLRLRSAALGRGDGRDGQPARRATRLPERPQRVRARTGGGRVRRPSAAPLRGLSTRPAGLAAGPRRADRRGALSIEPGPGGVYAAEATGSERNVSAPSLASTMTRL